MNCGRGPDQTGIREVEDRPEVAETVLDRRARERDPHARRDATQLLRGVARRVLDGLGFVEDHLAPRDVGDRLDVSHRGAVGGDHHVGVRRLRRRSRRTTARFAPWCTTTRKPGVKRAASAAQLPTTAAGAITSVGPWPSAGEHVREHRRRLAQAHVEREAATEPGRVEEAEPRQRFGLIAAEVTDEAARRGRRFGGEVRRRRQQIGGPAATLHRDPARERRALETEREAQHGRARQLRGRGAFGERGRRGVEVGAVDRDPASAGADQRPRFLGQSCDVGRGELDVVEHRRPPDIGELAGADDRWLGTPRRTPAASAPVGAVTAPGSARRSPAAASRGPVIAISSHASSWLRTTWPRRVPPGRRSAGTIRSRRVISSSRSRRFEPALTIACSIGTKAPLLAGGEHGEVPRVTAIGRVEPDDRARRDPASPTGPSPRLVRRAPRRRAAARRTRCRRGARGTPR